MKRFLLLPVFLVTLSAQPRVGILDFYGQRKISVDRIRKALGVKEGDPLPPSKLDLEEKLDKIGDVVASHVEAACCAGSDAVLYAGIEEKGAPHFETRSQEDGEELTLPAATDVEALRKAMLKASEASVRADAAVLLGDADPAQVLIDELQFAARDFDPIVRKAAVRGLVRMAEKVPSADPELKLAVQPTWMIEMLNSVVWSDRRAATEALMRLTDGKDDLLRAKIRERGFDSLLQMSQWKFLEHALPAYLLLCRVSGVGDDSAQASWTAGERDKVVARIQKEAKRK